MGSPEAPSTRFATSISLKGIFSVPNYEYKCTRDGSKFELWQEVGSEAPPCPGCGAPSKKVFGPPRVHFKGSGFYLTDLRAEQAGGKGGDKNVSEAGSDAVSDAKTETKTETKSDAKSESPASSPAPSTSKSATPAAGTASNSPGK